MMPLFQKDYTNITISEFYESYEQNKYDFEVKYQRKSGVWSEDKKSFLIDSIMKNYPLPPIFMRSKVDTRTGKTRYEIVDGKQRLQTIIGFIKEEVFLPESFEDDTIFDKASLVKAKLMNAKSFKEIQDCEELNIFVKQFWTYTLNVVYIYSESEKVISNVFDRLNRNGVPLDPQELRNAKYNQTYLLLEIEKLSNLPYWKEKYGKIKEVRMEDIEFISELFFLVGENKILDSSPNIIDRLYEKYCNIDSKRIDLTVVKFQAITNFLIQLELDFSKFKRLSWATHLYGLFSFGWYCINNDIKPEEVNENLNSLYNEYFTSKKNDKLESLIMYKDSCSSRTKSNYQRKNRLKAILAYCKLPFYSE